MRRPPLARAGLGEQPHHPAPPRSHLRRRARSVRPQPPSLRPMHVHVRQRLSASPPRSSVDRLPTRRRHCVAMPRPLRRAPLGSAPLLGLLHAAGFGRAPASDAALVRAPFLRAPPRPAAGLAGQRPLPPDDPTPADPRLGRAPAASGLPMSPSLQVAGDQNWNQGQVAPRLELGHPDRIRSELPGRLESEPDCQPRNRSPPSHGQIASSRSQ
jgi:hypothetical protein